MISIRKQLFLMLACGGGVILLVTSIAVNITTRNQFKEYIRLNMERTSAEVVELFEQLYSQEGDWVEALGKTLITQGISGNFGLSLLDANKELIWGKTQEELLVQIESLEYPVMYGKPITLINSEKLYLEEDIELIVDNELVGYVRIGYFPAYLLEYEDIMFQSRINVNILFCGIIALIVFGLLSAYITRLFTKPIYALARTSVDLATGRYSSRYMAQSKIKEIENLRYSINYLAQRLEVQDNLRKQLISDVSHEIRTPLHVLQSNLEAMIDGIYPIDEEQMQALYSEVVRFGSLLSNLDKLKNIEEDLVPVHLEQVMINPILREAYRSFKIVAKERNIIYRSEILISEGVIINADIHAMQQIFMNLLSNAFKFTKEGKINLKTMLNGRQIKVIIQDTGIGIAEKDLPNIFERMYRADKSREKYEGSGIGLTIVKKLVEEQNGTIEVFSEENKGTQVVCTFPIQKIDILKSEKTYPLKE